MRNLLLAIIGTCMIASAEARPNNKPHTRIVFEETIPDTLRSFVKRVFFNYRNVTANAEYYFPGILLISDSSMPELTDLNNSLVPILSMPGRLIFNTEVNLSLGELEEKLNHELFHVIKPKSATSVDTFAYRGYTVFAYHGLTLLIQKGANGRVHESSLLEEASANVVGKEFFKTDNLANLPGYRRVTNFLDNMVEQKWLKKRHLIRAESRNDVNGIIARMLDKKKRDVTPSDVILITDALFAYYGGKEEEMREMMDKIHKVRDVH